MIPYKDDYQVTIMLLDDDMITNMLMKTRLLKHYANLTVVDFLSSLKALDYLQENRVDLIFQDFIRPVMGGIEFLKILANDEKLKNIPVVCCSTCQVIALEAKELGKQTLCKPVSEEELYGAVDSILSNMILKEEVV